MNSFLISSTKKSSGKTVISIGLLAALKKLDKKVSVFKKGPDYIDPLWLSLASNKPCYNLDFFTMSKREIKNLYSAESSHSQISLVEANKGLFDGLSLNGEDSNAELAKLLNLDVVLVIDCEGMTRGIAPLLKGYREFDKKIKYHGVVLNKVNGSRHESKLVQTVENFSDIRVLGSIWKSANLEIHEQHLGLEPTFSSKSSKTKVREISQIISQSVDIKSFNTPMKKNKISAKNTVSISKDYSDLTIGIAYDSAFGFYYKDDINKFLELGVKIKFFNTIKDKKVPTVDALFIGGGFPELHLEKLSKNTDLKKDIKEFIMNRNLVYAECGGLMYLSDSITYNDKKYKMIGVIKGDIAFEKNAVGRGYVNVLSTTNHPWFDKPKKISCHEFHHSRIKLSSKRNKFAFKVDRGYGINGKYDGIIVENLLATYSHIRDTKQSRWITKFLDNIRKNINETKTNI